MIVCQLIVHLLVILQNKIILGTSIKKIPTRYTLSSSHQSRSGLFGIQKNPLRIQRIESRFLCLPFPILVSSDCTLIAYALNKNTNKGRGNMLQMNEHEGVLILQLA